jgi:transcriptional coactivator HFI1/ADA1
MGVPRIDVEPLFTALKAAIGEAWLEYKTTLNSFFLGTAFLATSTTFTSHTC